MPSTKVIVGAALIAAATSARALPPAQYAASSYTGNGTYGATSQFIYTTGTATSSITNPSGYVRGSASASGYQVVSAEGDGSGSQNQGIEGANGTYYFGIVGPSAVNVPIILSGVTSLYATGSSSVEVYETYGKNGSTYSNFGPITCFAGSSYCGTFNFTQTFSLLAGTAATAGDVGFTTLRIYLIAQDGAARGFIDPTITIDPSFADADLYSIVFTDGVGNPPGAVPEPGAWALMLTGFGLAGSALRTRRRAAVA